MKTPAAGHEQVARLRVLGDDAFFTTMGSASSKQFAALSVKKGGTAYVIKVYGPNCGGANVHGERRSPETCWQNYSG